MGPSTPFSLFPVPIASGLNLADGPGQLTTGELRRMQNALVAGRGRIEPRMAHGVVDTPTGDVVGVFRFPFNRGGDVGAVGAVWSGTAVSLYEIDTDGQWGATAIGSWSEAVSSRPIIRGDVLGQKLFLCGRAGATKLPLIYWDGATGALIRPSFSFVVNDPAAETYGLMYPREIRQYHNMIFAAGYGSEDDVDRPETVRFSFLGLFNDEQGAGDAGDPAVSGSENLFDIDDYFMLTERGAPVICMAPAMGRLLLLTPRSIHHLFGYDRNSFQVEHLDTGPGIDNPHSLTLANRTAFWWSPQNGPGFYTGSGFEEIGYKINPRLPEVDIGSLVARDVPQTHEVRWYWTYTNSAGAVVSKFVAWNYQLRQWQDDGLSPFRVFCAGAVATSSTNVSTGESSGSSGPAAPPSSFVQADATTTSVHGTWTNGDETTGTKTEVWLEGVLKATLDAGVAEYTFTGLTAGATYSGELKHKKNGQYSAALAFSITAAAAGTAPADPTNPSAVDDPVTDDGSITGLQASVYTSWTLGQSGVKTQVWRRLQSGTYGASPLVTTATDETSYRDSDVDSGESYGYKFRHVDPSDSSLVSGFTAEVLVGPLRG